MFCTWLALSTSLIVNPVSAAVDHNDPRQTLNVIYPKPEREYVLDNWYPLELLKLALKYSGQAYTLQSSIKMVQSRSLKELEHGELVNVVWSMTSIEREQLFKPIRIPIYKGLYGWRLLLTTEDKLSLFTAVKMPSELKKLYFIQGHDWPDTVILSDNGFQVSTSTSYDSLFNMLVKGRGDAFPRSILEVDWELKQLDASDHITTVPNVVFNYPAAIYFFVNSQRDDLHNAIKIGLEKAHQNGEFDKLFNRHFAEIIASAKLQEKMIIKLENTHLPHLTPINNSALWFTPEKSIQFHKSL
ncbi:transporter substrate-binding domain-containing protein [Pseudoalteromonas sp. SR44-8]|uniref:transporter substrate-binding domain-containing protein n=1 Tax=Pseudoalteromonas sp. SR44-8 TaxID=2760933 RepID=UPI0016022729|nr:transporter substrate-binding domain-containing protein [Pseudoalteromonas sp. SR44-8]MBB1302671.1 transporter substrate-binding domain-containing protein [Pseudoalteromonas sp. SR44-8]